MSKSDKEEGMLDRRVRGCAVHNTGEVDQLWTSKINLLLVEGSWVGGRGASAEFHVLTSGFDFSPGGVALGFGLWRARGLLLGIDVGCCTGCRCCFGCSSCCRCGGGTGNGSSRSGCCCGGGGGCSCGCRGSSHVRVVASLTIVTPIIITTLASPRRGAGVKGNLSGAVVEAIERDALPPSDVLLTWSDRVGPEEVLVQLGGGDLVWKPWASAQEVLAHAP